MLWFRDCANLAPDVASSGRETISSSMATTPLRCGRERWRTGKRSFKACAALHWSGSFIFGISIQIGWSRHGDQSGRLLHLTQALESAQPAAKLRLDLVTRNAQPAGDDLRPTAVAQAPSIGLIRVISNEHSNLRWRAIDLSPEARRCGIALERNRSQGRRTRNRVTR